MNKVLYIILISLFSLTIISCSSSSDGGSNNSSSTSWNGTYGTIVVPESDYFNIGSGNLWWSSNAGQRGYFYTGTNSDYSNPVQVAGVTSSSDCNSSYKGYTGLSDINDLSDASSLTYSIAPTPNNSQGAVFIASKSETSCDNEGMLVFTQAGRYGVLDFMSVSSDYSMTIKWWLGASGVTDFSQAPDPDTTAPTVTSVSTTADNQSSVSITDNITVTFSEAMDTTYVTTSTSDTNCSGTIRVSSDNFSTCVKMSSSSPASSNSNKTFTLDPYDNLAVLTTYLTRVTTGVKDTAGNAMSSEYETSSGFTTDNGSSSIIPTVSSVSTTSDNQSLVSIYYDNITVTFSKAMDTFYVTTNTSDSYCTGTIMVSSSSDNFSTGNCVKMSSAPASSNSDKTFTLDPYDNLTRLTTYLTRVTTGVKDTYGNAISSQYETSSGFTTDNGSIIASNSGLTSGTTYYWKVVASDPKGGSAQSETWSFIVQ